MLPLLRTATDTVPKPRSPNRLAGKATTAGSLRAPPTCTDEGVSRNRLPAEPAAYARRFNDPRSMSGVTPVKLREPALPTRNAGKPFLPISMRPPPDTSNTAFLSATIFPALRVMAPPSMAQGPEDLPSRQALIHWPETSRLPCAPISSCP
ncbi:hypothetical protein D3C85_1513220 [compost metagenome]